MPRSGWRTLWLVSILAVAPGRRFLAQEPAASGAVQGRVVSDLGRPVGGADIVVMETDGGRQRRTESDRSGAFRLGFLPPGRHLLTVRRIGYRASLPLLVELASGQTVTLTVTLEPVPVSLDSLVANAPRVAITLEDTEFGSRITAQELAVLPTFNEARTLVAFTPGARPDQIWGAASAQANRYQIDGVVVNHPGLGGDFLQPSVTWIEELEVRGLGAGAETGNFQGGIVNYITRSGTNRLEGQARFTAESHHLNGTNLGQAEVGREVGNRWEMDAQLRGPVVRDRLHFALFGQVIGRDERIGNFVPQEAGPLVSPPPEYSERKFMGKLSWRPGARDLAAVSVSRIELEGDPAGLDGFQSPEAGQTTALGTWLYNLSWRHTWSEQSDVDLRIGGYASRETRDPLNTTAVPGILTLQEIDALAYQNATFREVRRPTTLDLGLTWSLRGRALGVAHDLRLGVEYQTGGWEFNRIRNGGMTWRPFDRRQGPGWSPLDPATWVSQGAIASTWGGEVRLDSDVQNSAIFVQDYIALSSRIRVNPGLRFGRWVGTLTPTSGARFTAVTDQAVEPRIGLVVDLDGRGGLVAKAHWGRYHQSMFAAFFDRVGGSDVFTDEEQWSYLGTPFGDPTTRFTAAERDALATQGLFERSQRISLSETGPVENYRQPYVDQMVLGVEKTFGSAWKAQAAWVNRRNRNMVALVDRNLESNWTDFTDVQMLDRFFRPVLFGGEALVLDRLWISNKDIIYWWELLKSGVVQGGEYIPPGMTAAELDALTYEPDYVLTTVPEARRALDQLQVSVEGRYPSWWVSASGTLSRLEGNLNTVTGPDDYTTGGPGPWVRPDEQINFDGPLNNQSRLEFKVQAGGLLPGGFRGGVFFSFFEGDRVTPTLTVNPLLLEMRIQEPGQPLPTPFRFWFLSEVAGHRIFVQPRGTYRYPSRASLDLHLERGIPVRGGEFVVTADGFNVFGARSITSIQTSVNGLFDAFTGGSNFGQTRGRVPPRTLRLGAAFRF